MKKAILVAILSSVFIVGCSPKENASEQLSNPYDLNDDGIEDVSNENTDDGYYELVDRNFDGKVDESHFYNKSDKIQKSKIDDDLDGHLETEIYYKYGSVYLSSVDSNNDGLQDIFYFYKSGTLEKGIKYYVSDNGAKGTIGTIIFKFGYPSQEVISETELSQKKFAEKNYILMKP